MTNPPAATPQIAKVGTNRITFLSNTDTHTCCISSETVWIELDEIWGGNELGAGVGEDNGKKNRSNEKKKSRDQLFVPFFFSLGRSRLMKKEEEEKGGDERKVSHSGLGGEDVLGSHLWEGGGWLQENANPYSLIRPSR